MNNETVKTNPVPIDELPEYLRTALSNPVKRDALFTALERFFDAKPAITPGGEIYARLAETFTALANLHPTPTRAIELQTRFRDALGRSVGR